MVFIMMIIIILTSISGDGDDGAGSGGGYGDGDWNGDGGDVDAYYLVRDSCSYSSSYHFYASSFADDYDYACYPAYAPASASAAA